MNEGLGLSPRGKESGNSDPLDDRSHKWNSPHFEKMFQNISANKTFLA